jgi:hypothetical protein
MGNNAHKQSYRLIFEIEISRKFGGKISDNNGQKAQWNNQWKWPELSRASEMKRKPMESKKKKKKFPRVARVFFYFVFFSTFQYFSNTHRNTQAEPKRLQSWTIA